jgi:IclR family acetate operon transcriptional repressor
MPRDAGRPARTVGSVERAMAILDALAEAPAPLGTNELARRVGTNASSVSRLLGTLAAGGLVERVADTGRYRLGTRLLVLGARVQARLDVRDLARPLLERLEAETGETATLSLPAGGEAVTIEFVASRASVRSMAAVGRPSIAHATAVGKVMLAFGETGPEALAAPLARFTPHTITDPAALAAEVGRARAEGLASARGEREPDLNAIAAPVLDHHGALAAILGLQGPAGRFDEARMAAAARPLRAAALDLARAIGRH